MSRWLWFSCVVVALVVCSCNTNGPLSGDVEQDGAIRTALKLSKSLDVNDVDSIYAIVTGDNIEAERYFPIAINTATDPPSYSGFINRPAEGNSWTVTIVLLDDSGKKIGQGSSAITDVTAVVTVAVIDSRSAIPTVNAGTDAVTGVGDTVWLQGSASDSFGGTIDQWEWDVGNTGTFVTSTSGGHNFVAPAGETPGYECVLRVTDDDGNSAFDTLSISVRTTATGMVLVDSGSFVDDSGNVASVSSFYMDKTEVTQADWQLLTGTIHSHFSGSTLPVEWVTWYDALFYCNARSKAMGLDTAYSYDSLDSPYTPGASSLSNVVCSWSATGYRLPTEDEWEYACRAGTTTDYHWGSIQSDGNAYAWYSSNSNGLTHPVAQKQTNNWGLFDMAGNVWEWCWDWEGTIGRVNNRTDYRGGSSGAFRIFRGGSWDTIPSFLRSSFRRNDGSVPRIGSVGFRVVLPAQ